jgi:hypothetical protein
MLFRQDAPKICQKERVQHLYLGASRNWRRTLHNPNLKNIIFPFGRSLVKAFHHVSVAICKRSYCTAAQFCLGTLGVWICIAIPAISATYYVSPFGSDSYTGTATNSPWETVEKVNTFTFLPGDQVLFKRGGEWRGNLEVPSSGTPDHPILFGAYGTGKKPCFFGSELVPNADFQHHQGAVYKVEIPGSPGAVLLDGQFLLGGTPVANIQSTADVEATSLSWYWDAGTLYINAGGSNPNVDSRNYLVCLRTNLIDIDSKSNIVVRGLAVDGSARYDGGYGIFFHECRDVLLEDCDVFRAGKHHVSVINTTGFIGRGLYGAYAMPAQGNGGATTYVSYSDHNYSYTTSIWTDCVAEHMEDTFSGKTYGAFVTHGDGIGSVVISNMISYGANISLANEERETVEVSIYGGTIHDANLAMFSHGGRVSSVHISNGKLELSGDNNIAESMLIEGYSPNDGYYSAVVFSGTGNTLRHSTVVLDPGSLEKATCLVLSKNGTESSWYGNILSSPHLAFRKYPDSPLETNDITLANYNLYFPAADFREQNTYHSFDQWQALGHDVDSISTDPLFANAQSNNFRLTANSPCIDSLTAADPKTDVFGIARPMDGNADGLAAMDLGSYEFASPISDTDGDAMCDADEVIADTNPCDPTSKLVFTRTCFTNNQFEMTWNGGRLANQYIESASSLAGPWQTIYTNTAPTETKERYSTPCPLKSGFFRIRAGRPLE